MFILDTVRGSVMYSDRGFLLAVQDTLLSNIGFDPNPDNLWWSDASDDIYFMDWYQARKNSLDGCNPRELIVRIHEYWKKDHKVR